MLLNVVHTSILKTEQDIHVQKKQVASSNPVELPGALSSNDAPTITLVKRNNFNKKILKP